MAAEEYDLFVSYRRKNFDRVLPLVVALRERGLRVWLDQSSIQDFDPVTDDIPGAWPTRRRSWRGTRPTTPSRGRVRWS
jgi:hypothetical protein